MLIINIILVCRMHGVGDLMINVTPFISRSGAQLACSAKNRDLSIKNAGFLFMVEICDFSVSRQSPAVAESR